MEFCTSNLEETVSITGGDGYIGAQLISELSHEQNLNIRILSRKASQRRLENNVADVKKRYFLGNLIDPQSLTNFIKPHSTVVSLTYDWEGGQAANINAIRNLVEQCVLKKISRLIHCSTAAVVGRSASNWVDETTQCNPQTEYGRTKLAVENLLRGYARMYGFELVILRPTSVFGPGGSPLNALCSDLLSGNHVKNYLRSSLFGDRSMNLVPVENVTAAIRHFIFFKDSLSIETFFVSDDDQSENNYKSVEEILRSSMGLPMYPFAPVKTPKVLLDMLLRIRGRDVIDSRSKFNSDILKRSGYSSPKKLSDAIYDYGNWFLKNNPISSHIQDRTPKL